VEYSLHEFGSMDASHDFAYWPGLSLNPGVWDLAAVRAALGGGGGDLFDTRDTRFEQAWSLAAYRAGLRMGHLKCHVFRHIGTDSSAYVANGQPRPWDAEARQEL
jgi:integrase